MTEMRQVARLAAPTPDSAASNRLSRKQKAAIIVRFLLSEGADIPLTDLPEPMQAELTRAMGGMRYVDRDTLAQVLLEFADELESFGLAFPRDIGGALSALDGKISPHTAARLRREAGVRQTGDPWDMIRGLEVGELKTLVDGESTEVAAVILSKLDVSRAAALLGRLPGEKARAITLAVSQTSGVTPDAVDRIGLTLAAQIADRPPRAFAEQPEKRLGAILNISPASLRDEMLTGLTETDERFARAVRKAIFTFADIAARVDPKDVPQVVRSADTATLIPALAAAQGPDATDGMRATADYLLDNMSRRLADQLRDDIAQAGTVSFAEGEAAMNNLVSVIRDLELAGELTLTPPPETDG